MGCASNVASESIILKSEERIYTPLFTPPPPDGSDRKRFTLKKYSRR